MTNLEKIRAMSAEELASLINEDSTCGLCVHRHKACTRESNCWQGVVEWLNKKYIEPMPELQVGDIIVVLLDKGLINKIVVGLIVMSDKYASNINGVMYNLEDLNIRTIKRMNNTNERVEVIWRRDG